MEESCNIAVCYCIIDNYDDVVEASQGESTNLLFALVEQQINNFTKKINGMFKRVDKDRYLIILNTIYIDSIKKGEYNLIQGIKALNPSLPITLSIGLCYGSGTISVINDGARSALDLALGRGGDQLVIKNDSDYEFFGDAEIEHKSRSSVKARVKSTIFSELVGEFENILIMGHSQPDLDCIASAIGTFRIVKTVNPYSICKIVMNEYTSSISKLAKKLEEHSEYNNNVFVSNKEAISFANKNTLLIVVDVFRTEGTECPELLGIVDSIVVFDNHRKSTDFIKNPVFAYHDSAASSTSELITEMIIHLKEKTKLLKIEADALLSGITVDTKNFIFKTSYKTFEVAAFLKKNGASSHNVHKLLQSDLDLYKIKSEAVNNAIFHKDIVAMTTIDSIIDNPVLVVAQTADELLNLTDIKASFVFFPINDRIYISARSLGEINVQVIMEIFGGGGHRTIAAAQVTGLSIEDIMSTVKNHIDTIIDK